MKIIAIFITLVFATITGEKVTFHTKTFSAALNSLIIIYALRIKAVNQMQSLNHCYLNAFGHLCETEPNFAMGFSTLLNLQLSSGFPRVSHISAM